jgi:signal transduction histidine kinase
MFLFAVTCFLACFVNILDSLPLLHTIIIFFTTLLFGYCYFLARFKQSITIPTLAFCIMAIFVLPIVVWLTNGGNSGSYPYFMGSITFPIWMILRGKIRIAGLIAYPTVMVSLLFLEFKHPEWIIGYNSRSAQLMDTSFAVIFTILTSAVCIALIMSAYNAKQSQLLDAHKKQLAHTEKLVTLGTLVSGVAHEVNNPNNSLMLDVEAIRKVLTGVLPILEDYTQANSDFEIRGFSFGELKHEITALTDRMKRNSERIKRIVSDLRAFSKNDVIMTELVKLNDVVSSALGVTEYVMKACTSNFHVTFGDNIPVIKGNIQYLEQVVINLVKNACQALPDSEKGVFISTTFDEKAKAIVLTVRDEGKGMDEATLKNLFTPFFTTKGKEGTGLGLSICNNIVKSHGGKIEVESKVGHGTAIRVILPAYLPT